MRHITRRWLSAIAVAVLVVASLLTSSALVISAASGSAYAVATTFGFPVINYSVTGYSFGKQVGTYHDGSYRYHLGEDVLAPVGTTVRAVANGWVKRIYTNTDCFADRWGTLVIIEHQLLPGDPAGTNAYSMYGHLRASDIQVTENTEIRRGDIIGYVGANGPENGCWEPHLHFAIHRGAYDGGIQGYGHGADITRFWNPSDFITNRMSDVTPTILSYSKPITVWIPRWYYLFETKDPRVTEVFLDNTLLFKGSNCGTAVWLNIGSYVLTTWYKPTSPEIPVVDVKPWPFVTPSCAAEPNDPPPNDPPPIPVTDQATFVADVTYSDGASVSPGQTFNKTWRLKNTGTSTWNGYCKISVKI